MIRSLILTALPLSAALIIGTKELVSVGGAPPVCEGKAATIYSDMPNSSSHFKDGAGSVKVIEGTDGDDVIVGTDGRDII
ncbi:MAG: hypothetical protein H0W30_19665, partial [Gemmatimonadaceae bacterium]|nr:hypothetical protein [Gemmatimonadaceae bacterium]